jgi:AFG3 family protein
MEDRKDQVRLVAELLLEKETITNMDVTNLIGARPFVNNKEYADYIAVGWNAVSKVVSPAEHKDEEENTPAPVVVV